MKYLKSYNKLFEGSGDVLPNDDRYLNLLKDLSLEVSDHGFKSTVKGYESYGEGYNTYDIIFEGELESSVYDINKQNIDDLNKQNIDDLNKLDQFFDSLTELKRSTKDLVIRAIDNGLYLCSYEVHTYKDKPYSFIRFTSRQDNNPVGSEYRYYDPEDDY